MDGPLSYWFVRYRSPHETDHLRLRIHLPDPDRYAAYTVAVGNWARRLRHEGVLGRLAFDTYRPEIGRYGHGPAIWAAEAVFAADSRAVAAGLRGLPAALINPHALAAVSMVDIAHGFLGSLTDATGWLTARPAPATTTADRTAAEQAVHWAADGAPREVAGWPDTVVDAWQARAAALSGYRRALPADADTDAVLEALLHMHHNRALGVDVDREATCRRLARQAALAWQAQRNRRDR